MDVRVDSSWVESHVLHDVDLAARRPANLANARAERPDRRPGAAAFRQFRPHLDAPIRPIRAAGQACRGVVPALVRFPMRLDDQHSPFDARVLGPAAGVILQLLVSDESDLVIPAAGVGQTAAVELVLPDWRTSRRRRGRSLRRVGTMACEDACQHQQTTSRPQASGQALPQSHDRRRALSLSAPFLREAGRGKLQPDAVDSNRRGDLVIGEARCCGFPAWLREKPLTSVRVDIEPRQKGFECGGHDSCRRCLPRASATRARSSCARR